MKICRGNTNLVKPGKGIGRLRGEPEVRLTVEGDSPSRAKRFPLGQTVSGRPAG
jgi:hypothetical protein